MTLKEAIDYFQELIAEDDFDGCKRCKEEYQQLLGWLLELETFRQKRRGIL